MKNPDGFLTYSFSHLLISAVKNLKGFCISSPVNNLKGSSSPHFLISSAVKNGKGGLISSSVKTLNRSHLRRRIR